MIVCEPGSQARTYRCNHPDVIDVSHLCSFSFLLNIAPVTFFRFQVLHKLGLVCMKQKEFGESKKYYAEAIARQTQLTSPAQKLKLAEGDTTNFLPSLTHTTSSQLVMPDFLAGLLGQATVYFLTGSMNDSKINLTRARELATEVLGSRHHYVAAISNRVSANHE